MPRQLPDGFDSATIEPYEEGFEIVGHGEYGDTSVLAGQYRRALLGFFDSIEEAQDEYPDAEILDHNTISTARVPDLPPTGFDPADAGERWDDDY